MFFCSFYCTIWSKHRSKTTNVNINCSNKPSMAALCGWHEEEMWFQHFWQMQREQVQTSVASLVSGRFTFKRSDRLFWRGDVFKTQSLISGVFSVTDAAAPFPESPRCTINLVYLMKSDKDLMSILRVCEKQAVSGKATRASLSLSFTDSHPDVFFK